MAWRLRKTLNLGAGFRLNLSKSGVGLSGGVRGFRIGIGPRGKRVQVSAPGTGLGYSLEEGWQQPVRRTRPSLFAFVLLAILAALAIHLLGFAS